jgi:formyltetrahydrofolate hydrolase
MQLKLFKKVFSFNFNIQKESDIKFEETRTFFTTVMEDMTKNKVNVYVLSQDLAKSFAAYTKIYAKAKTREEARILFTYDVEPKHDADLLWDILNKDLVMLRVKRID